VERVGVEIYQSGRHTIVLTLLMSWWIFWQRSSKRRMVNAQRFPYRIIDSNLGMVDRMPYLPLSLGFSLPQE